MANKENILCLFSKVSLQQQGKTNTFKTKLN